jgi:hypothetical protein
MKVLVTGSRDWPWTERKIITDALVAANVDIVVHGNARGADSVAKWWAAAHDVEQRVYPAQWNIYGNAAGPIRNQQMLDKEHLDEAPIERVLAFPTKESKGTWDMVKRAEAAGIRVTIYYIGPPGMAS